MTDACTFMTALFSPYAETSELRIEIRPLHPASRKETLYPDGSAPPYWASRTPYGTREWFLLTPAGIAGAARHALRLGSEYESYFGVLPRVGRTGTQADVVVAGWLWCDVD